VITERLSLASKIAKVKHLEGRPIVDPDTELAVIENMIQTSKELGIEPRFARRLAELLIEQSVKAQSKSTPQQSKDLLLKEIFEITQRLMSQGKKITRFEVGEPNFPPSQQTIRALTDSFRKRKIVGYGAAAGLPELRKTLAEELSAEHNVRIEADQILITPGGRFGIFATVTSFVSQLERVVIPQPVWPAYEECVNFVKGRVIPIKSTLENNWETDFSKVESELKKGVRLIVINNPNNPTGKMISEEKFQQLIDLAQQYDTMILSDEVYDRYVRSKSTSILEHESSNFVYINSFSKQFSLTGWRIGYLVTSKEKAMRIRRIIQTAVTCVPEFIQRAALVAIKKGHREAQRNIKAILRKVDVTCRELSKINVSFYKPDGAFYVFPRANRPGFDSAKFAKRLLEQRYMSLSPGQSFGDYPSFFRLAVSLPEAQISSAIEAIGKAIDDWS
jgi:aspartate aminotransferase